MSAAEDIMHRYNPNALIGEEDDGSIAMIEDVSDPDDRMYRMEFRATPDGRRAIAYCRYNPWGSVNGGEEYADGHVADDGFICMGTQHTGRGLNDSPYSIEYVIERARYWCTGFSYLKEHGEFPQM